MPEVARRLCDRLLWRQGHDGREIRLYSLPQERAAQMTKAVRILKYEVLLSMLEEFENEEENGDRTVVAGGGSAGPGPLGRTEEVTCDTKKQ